MTAAAGQQRSKATFVQRGRGTRGERKGRGRGRQGRGDSAGGERRQPPNRRPSAKLAQASHQAGKAVRQLGSHSAWL